MSWTRADGWPRQAARVVLLGGLLWLGTALALGAASGMVALAGLTIALSLLLALWRRGVTLDGARSTVTHWYGLGPWRLREFDSRSLAGYERVEVERAEHYKGWRAPYRVVLRRANELTRLPIDDEFRSAEQARQYAVRVAGYLGWQGPSDT